MRKLTRRGFFGALAGGTAAAVVGLATRAVGAKPIAADMPAPAAPLPAPGWGDTTGCPFAVGDFVTIEGHYITNPLTSQVTAHPQVFVITAVSTGPSVEVTPRADRPYRTSDVHAWPTGERWWLKPQDDLDKRLFGELWREVVGRDPLDHETEYWLGRLRHASERPRSEDEQTYYNWLRSRASDLVMLSAKAPYHFAAP